MQNKYDSEMNKVKQKRRTIRKKQKMIVLCTSLAMLLIVGTIIISIRIGYSKSNIKVNADVSDEDSYIADGVPEDDIKDNEPINDNKGSESSGYLLLKDDPNAEDALQVFANTEGLLKGTKTYPVRDDGKKVAYLTFDDGPSTENTENVLSELDKNGVKGTFFVVGKSIDNGESSKKILKKIAENGHAIGNHTYTHNYNKLYPGRTIDKEAFIEEVDKCNESLKRVLGEDFSTRVIRFPGGYWSWNGRTAIRPIIEERGYAIIDWNSLNRDSEGAKKDASQLVKSLIETTEALGPNADSVVVLMHDTYGKSETVKSLKEIIDYFRQKGFEFKTIK